MGRVISVFSTGLTRFTRSVAIASVAVGLSLIAAPAAHGSVVRVDPGAKAAGKPIWGTSQHLPPMMGTADYEAGPQNSQAIEDYYTTGQARRDQSAVVRRARSWITEWVADNCGGAPASCAATVVFDVDDTLLSGYPYYEGTGFTWNSGSWDAYVQSCQSPAIEPSRELFRSLKRKGFVVILLTGRSEAERSSTADCLRQRGISGWDRLIMQSPAQESLSSAMYKAQERAQLERSGLRIVASIGDQVSDMSRGHLKAGFLMPNLMYFIS